MRFLVLIAACAALAAAVPVQEVRRVEFDQWRMAYGRNYDSDAEYEQRFQNYLENVDLIEERNAMNLSYKLAVNQFADMSWEEFKSTHLGADQHCSATSQGNFEEVLEAVPSSRDWRDDGIVSKVKDQGHCGSCWTFSTTGCLEAVHAKKTGKIVLLSEQQLIDCAQAFDNHGCNGGLPSHAFEYIHYNGGLDTEGGYPYEAQDGKCRYQKSNVGATVNGVVNITEGAESDLRDAVGVHNPVSVAFEVVSDFRFYSSGVYDSTECKSGAMDVNHAVLAVGYNSEGEKPYWIIKNSWGTSFGIDGYFWMARGKNMCGVATCASYPTV